MIEKSKKIITKIIKTEDDANPALVLKFTQ